MALPDEQLYALASDRTLARIAAAVSAAGGDEAQAASALGLSVSAVRAAQAASALDGTDATAAGQSASALDVIQKLVGLAASVGVLVIVLGGVVLYARLSFEKLPGQSVFGQLPHDFLVTVGLGQVLAPALGLGAAHALIRIVKNTDKPGSGAMLSSILLGLLWFALIVGCLIYRDIVGRKYFLDFGSFRYWATAVASIAIVTIVAVGIRWRSHEISWPLGPRWLALTLTYTFAATVPATFIAATYPLLDARACMSTGFAENGLLVGRSADSVFLGERGPARRIAALPKSNVEELFIGRDAQGAQCDPRGSAAAVTARAAAAAAAEQLDAVERASAAVMKATTLRGAEGQLQKLVVAGRAGARAIRIVADAAPRTAAEGPASVDQLGTAAHEVEVGGENVRHAADAADDATTLGGAKDWAVVVRTDLARTVPAAWRLAREALRDAVDHASGDGGL